MSPDFISATDDDTAEGTIEQVRASTLSPGMLTTVYVCDQERRLTGSVLIVTLLRVEPQTPLEHVAEKEPVSVGADADLPEVARTMTDYNLVMLPVLDEEQRLVGVVTVDDVLELMLPTGWRRRFGVVRD